MDRRKYMQSMGLATTHILFPGILGSFVMACQNKNSAPFSATPIFFSKDQFQLVEQVVDIIIPATQSKSASQVFVHFFLDEVFAKCMNPEQQQQIKDGMDDLFKQYTRTPDQLEALVENLDLSAYQQEEDSRFFIWIKQYTLIGFFGSQEGMTVASDYNELPGTYIGDVPVDKSTLNQGKTDLRFYL